MSMDMIRSDELLTTACFRGELERVRQMLDHGAATSARCERLTTALHWAASMGHIDVCELLVERGADVNARSVNGETPLHVAAREGDAETVEFMLGAGANPRMCNTAGRTALELALEFAEDEVELIHLLRTAQAQWDARALRTSTAATAAPSAAPAGAEPTPPRRKVQIVWESDLKAAGGDSAAAASSSAGGVVATRSVDSACGPDEPLDLSDGAPIGATPSDVSDGGLAAGLASCSIASSSPGNAAPAADDLSASALSSLAAKLFAWDAASRDDGLPG